MKKIFYTALILILTSSASAEVYYEAEIEGGQTMINTSIQTECDIGCPGLEWRILEDAEVLHVEDNRGEIDYEVQEEKLSIPARTSIRDSQRTVKILKKIEDSPEEVHNGLYTQELSLPSLNQENTSGIIKTENLVSAASNPETQHSINQEKLSFQTEGPANINLNFGKGNKTEHYEFFGEKPEEPDRAFELALGTIQKQAKIGNVPVAVIPAEKYEQEQDSWSAGKYTEGRIKIREDLENNFLPVLSHETVHGLNHEHFSWDETSTAYLDEGIAEYTEFLMTKKLYKQEETDIGPAQLFGEKETYQDSDDPRKRYEVESQGNREELWNYYQQEEDFMKDWSPNNHQGHRSFGYAYSQLVIRNHVKENNSIKEIYEHMEEAEQTTNNREKWSFLSEKIELKPCKTDSRQEFDECLDQVNEQDYKINMVDQDSKEEQLDIQEIELEERSTETGLEHQIQLFKASVTDKILYLEDYIRSFLKV